MGINAKKEPGYYADGGGLYLRISKGGTKGWIFRFMLRGRSRAMGLGSVRDKTLTQARDDAAKCRQLLLDGIDPITHREAAREALRQQEAEKTRKVWTFQECAAEYHSTHSNGWRNAKHAQQWFSSLANHAFPILGDKDVNHIGKPDILAVLEPIWLCHHETASRIRQRIKVILDWAAARDFRTNQFPHLWDQLERALPRTKDVRKPVHYLACPYEQVGRAFQAIRECGASSCIKQAMEFTILTAARTGMVRMAVWQEFDLSKRRWTIPAERMKAGIEHRVPLSQQVLAILKNQARGLSKPHGLVFPTPSGKAHSDMTFTMQLRRLGLEYTMHGFRSTFRDWAAEQTIFPSEVCEAALAHTTRDATEAAYFRSDLFEKRRDLMDHWAEYCEREHCTAANQVQTQSEKL
ncbi:phage integrase [Duganella caerulea]|uniref:tyrosine-type recombinase/integrase n=1 Tax=Duganella caerulea TaxID=2885762 RepID=UPI0030E79AD5